MEQILWRSDIPRPRPVVPYLCEDILDAICDQVGNLRVWPALKQWDLSQEIPVATSAARCQAWLFFGLLQILTSMNGGRFDVNDFVTDLGGRKVVNSTGVQLLIQEASVRAFAREPTENEDAQTRMGGCLFDELRALLPDAVKWIIRVAQKHEEDTSPYNLWNSELYNVFLSALLLVETVCDVAIERDTIHAADASCHCKPWLRLFGISTRTLHESFKHLGHCASLFNRVNLSLSTACQALALPAETDFDHSKCDVENCRSYNVDHESYVPQHTKGCDRCSLVRIDTNMLCHIIRKNAIPLIRSTLTSDGEVRIDIIDGTDIRDYAAISHLWAGGLGNMNENAHYHCQLKQIHVDLTKMPRSILPYKTTPTPIYYWLDSLCIPVSIQTLKIRAINTMAQIYAGSKTVLVVDPYLSSRHAVDMSLQELDLAVLCSPWMARSWTLQEGALAVNVVFRFADRLISFEQIKCIGGQIRNTSIQSLWSQDVDRIMPRARYDLGFDPLWGYVSIFGYNVGHFSRTGYKDMIAIETDSTNYAKFIRSWNELSRRSTSESADISAILGTLIDRNASEVLNLSEHARIQALLRTQTVLPSGLLFTPIDSNSPTWSPCPPSRGHQSYPLQFTDDTMEFLPSGIFRIDCLKSMQALRSHQPISLFEKACIYMPESKSYCHVKFHDSICKPTESTTKDIVLLFNKLSHGNPQYNSGKCFTLTKATEDGLYLRYMRSFTYEHLGRNKECHIGQCDSQSHALNFFEIQCVSSTCPLLIDMLVEWPKLRWSRSEYYPFTESSRQVASWLHLFDLVFLVVASATFTVTYSQFMSAIRTPAYSSTALMIPIASYAFLILHNYLLNVEYIYFRKLTNRDLQQKWAVSFSIQKKVSESGSHSPQYTRMIIFYTMLLAVTYVLTVVMFVRMPAVQNMWDRGFHLQILVAVFQECLLDVKPDGSLHPWYIFIIRHACRSIFAELFIRATIIVTVSLKRFFPPHSTTQNLEHEVGNRISGKIQMRLRAAKLFSYLVIVPGMISFIALAWMSAIISGTFRFKGSWSWGRLLNIYTLLHGTISVIRLIIVVYGPPYYKFVKSMRNSLAAFRLQMIHAFSRCGGRKTDSDIQLSSIQ